MQTYILLLSVLMAANLSQAAILSDASTRSPVLGNNPACNDGSRPFTMKYEQNGGRWYQWMLELYICPNTADIVGIEEWSIPSAPIGLSHSDMKFNANGFEFTSTVMGVSFDCEAKFLHNGNSGSRTGIFDFILNCFGREYHYTPMGWPLAEGELAVVSGHHEVKSNYKVDFKGLTLGDSGWLLYFNRN